MMQVPLSAVLLLRALIGGAALLAVKRLLSEYKECAKQQLTSVAFRFVLESPGLLVEKLASPQRGRPRRLRRRPSL